MVSNQVGKVAGIILAAGTSSRMGHPKLLLPVGGKAMVARVLSESVRSDLDHVWVVLGHKSERIGEALGPLRANPKVRVVVNPDYASGMSSSIRVGILEAAKDNDHVMIILGDMPFVDAGVINGLIGRYRSSCCAVGAVRVRGRRSHPVIFGRKMFPALLKLSGDAGARSLFQAQEERLCLVDVGGEYDDRDIDTVEDYARLQERSSDV